MSEISHRSQILIAAYIILGIIATFCLGYEGQNLFESYGFSQPAIEAMVLFCLHIFGYIFLTPLKRMGFFRFLKFAIINSVVLFGLFTLIDYLFGT